MECNILAWSLFISKNCDKSRQFRVPPHPCAVNHVNSPLRSGIASAFHGASRKVDVIYDIIVSNQFLVIEIWFISDNIWCSFPFQTASKRTDTLERRRKDEEYSLPLMAIPLNNFFRCCWCRLLINDACHRISNQVTWEAHQYNSSSCECSLVGQILFSAVYLTDKNKHRIRRNMFRSPIFWSENKQTENETLFPGGNSHNLRNIPFRRASLLFRNQKQE